MISDRVAPFGRPIICRIIPPLLSLRGIEAFRGDFFSASACLRGFARVAVFRLLGAPFLWLATFFDAVFCGATVAPSAVPVVRTSLAAPAVPRLRRCRSVADDECRAI